MTPMTKEALAELHIPKRKAQNWSSSVMRNCDFCSQWALTAHHEDGGCICASCCDGEYITALRSALEMAIEQANAKDTRIAELEKALKWLTESRASFAETSITNRVGLEEAEKQIAELQSRAESAEQALKARDAQSGLDVAKLEEVLEWIRGLDDPTKAAMDSFIKLKYFIIDYRKAAGIALQIKGGE